MPATVVMENTPPDISAFRLDTESQTVVIASFDKRNPCIIYWGAPLPQKEDLDILAQNHIRSIPPGTLDIIPEVSMCPEEGRGFMGHPGFELKSGEGAHLLTQGIVVEFPTGIVTDDTIEIKCALRGSFDGELSIRIEILGDLICLSQTISRPKIDTANIFSGSSSGILPLWIAAPTVPLSSFAPAFIDYEGRWTKEFGEVNLPFKRGQHVRENRSGRTGHDHFPGLLIPENRDSSNEGGCFAMTLGWSGSHKMIVETMPNGARYAQFGMLDPIFDTAGEITSPPLYLTYSSQGRDGAAQQMHTGLRNYILPEELRQKIRPVHYNSWEAVYFDHDIEELKTLAGLASDVGAERFVLDDGWFGKRDDDTTSLGDWIIDDRKYPDGLSPLIDHVNELGLGFGLWVEPEMVNPESDLAHAHPDWVIDPSGFDQMLGRNQQILNLSIPEVTEYLFQRLDVLLSLHNIEYLKWDMNRAMTLALDDQSKDLRYKQTQALYKLLDQLRSKFPDVEIESCASGGGRIDYGILARTHRVWLSDSNDAHERARMQVNALQFLPPEIIGSHVGPRHCHTSSRNLSMPFRAGIAMMTHMGFEMDLRELTQDEKKNLTRYTALYKEHRSLMHSADVYKIATGNKERYGVSYIAKDGSEFLTFVVQEKVNSDEAVGGVRIVGLEHDQFFECSLLNAEEIAFSASRISYMPIATGSVSMSGQSLKMQGLMLPNAHPDQVWIIHGVRR